MEWLKKLLESATIKDGVLDIDGLMATVTKEFPKHAVPKEEFNNKVGELKTATDTITSLKDANKDNEELQKTIKEHEGTISTMKGDYESQLKNLKIDSAITSLLTSNKAKHSDLLSSKFDREKLVVDGDKVIGLDEQLKTIKESYKDMFSQTVAGKTPANPDTKSKGSTAFETLVNNADTMSAEEVAEQFAAMEAK